MNVECHSHIGKIEEQLKKKKLGPQHIIVHHSKIHIFMGSTQDQVIISFLILMFLGCYLISSTT